MSSNSYHFKFLIFLCVHINHCCCFFFKFTTKIVYMYFYNSY